VPKLRILVADDHRVVAEGLSSILSRSFDVIGTVHNGHALIAETINRKPDVVVSDIFMTDLNGIDALRQLRKQGTHARFIFLTMEATADLATEAFRAGASGFVSKQDAGEELLEAIGHSMEGRFYLTPSLREHQIEIIMEARASQAVANTPDLSSRQREVLQLLAEGKTVKEAAGILGISPRTAESHKYEMMRHLRIKTTAELIRWALRLNLISSRSGQP
jgi:DNA-binding NarL/FixJ family response regulator